jgi:hypothetical protein
VRFVRLLSVVVLVVNLSSCADDHPGSALAGTWSGSFTWENGDRYPVSIVVVESSITGRSLVKFAAVESAAPCNRVDVSGTFEPTTNKIVLDETSSECDGFILDGLYRGTFDRATMTMTLPWSGDDSLDPPTEGTDDELEWGMTGELVLTKSEDVVSN